MPHGKLCLDCSATCAPTRSRCPACQRKANAKHNAPRAKYHTLAWRKRKRGPCAVCGSTHYVAGHHVFNVRDEDGWEGPVIPLCASCHGTYESDVRNEKDTEHRRLVEAIGGRT